MRGPILAAAAALALALAGCATQTDAPLSPAFGAAVASMNAQIIDPEPARGPPVSSGAKAARAIERYEEDRVKDPPGAYKETRSNAPDEGGGDQGPGGGESPKP